jgi:hypothetical protein
MPHILVSTFINPRRGSREHNAICRAEQMPVEVVLIGEYGDERYYRVLSSHKGQTPYVVVRWRDPIEGELVRCECRSHTLKPWSEPCWHIAKVLIYEATQEPSKVASIGRNKNVHVPHSADWR